MILRNKIFGPFNSSFNLSRILQIVRPQLHVAQRVLGGARGDGRKFYDSMQQNPKL